MALRRLPPSTLPPEHPYPSPTRYTEQIPYGDSLGLAIGGDAPHTPTTPKGD